MVAACSVKLSTASRIHARLVGEHLDWTNANKSVARIDVVSGEGCTAKLSCFITLHEYAVFPCMLLHPMELVEMVQQRAVCGGRTTTRKIYVYPFCEREREREMRPERTVPFTSVTDAPPCRAARPLGRDCIRFYGFFLRAARPPAPCNIPVKLSQSFTHQRLRNSVATSTSLLLYYKYTCARRVYTYGGFRACFSRNKLVRETPHGRERTLQQENKITANHEKSFCFLRFRFNVVISLSRMFSAFSHIKQSL